MNNTRLNKSNILKETVNGINQICITDELMNGRDIFLEAEVTTESMSDLMQQLLYLEKDSPGTPINLYINSPGGSVSDGLAVYDLIQMMNSPITTICTGRASSMGAILFLAADKRLMLPHSEIMIHDASFGQADFAGLKPDEIEEKTKDLLDTCKTLRDIVASRTGQSSKKVTEKMKKDSYFKASEAIDFGLATGVVENIDMLIKKGDL